VSRSVTGQVIDRWAAERDCGWCGKVCFRSRAAAEACASELILRVLGAERTYAYKCLKRDWWHLTRERQSPSRGGGQ
jgi:hypothetical protein